MISATKVRLFIDTNYLHITYVNAYKLTIICNFLRRK